VKRSDESKKGRRTVRVDEEVDLWLSWRWDRRSDQTGWGCGWVRIVHCIAGENRL